MKQTRSLAAAWLLAGVRALSRSFRLHRHRGAFCHRGWCQQCKITGPDGRVTLACTLPEQQNVPPPRNFDPLRIIGKMAESLPPWFWERHAFGPGLLQQVYLKIMRRLSAAPRLSPLLENGERGATEKRDCDTLVVGAGISGLVAATKLAETGRRVVLIEAAKLGGSSLERPAEHTSLDPLLAIAQKSVETFENTLCVGLYENPRQALCVGPDKNILFQFNELIVATGAYDRIPTVVGNDLPGIIGLRAFERLAFTRSISSNFRIGLYGSAIELGRALVAAQQANLKMEFVAGPDDVPDSSHRSFENARLLAVGGGAGVEYVELSGAGKIGCDILVACFSQPSYELQAQSGSQMESRGEPPVVCPSGKGWVPMLVVGEAAGWFEPLEAAERSASAVADWLAGEVVETPAWTSRTVDPVPVSDDAFLCFCEDVRVRDVRRAIADGYADVELVKRHTGAATGPCQGKLCHGALLGLAAESGLQVRIPTPRPLIRPVLLADLAGARCPPAVSKKTCN